MMSLYSRRVVRNKVWLSLSVGAAVFGLLWLVLILSTLLWNGVAGLKS